MSTKTKRVLQIIRSMNCGGAQTFIMNLYRNINKKKIQFDFLVCEDGYYDTEIIQNGGKIYKIPYITDIGQIKYKKELKKFFYEHNEYDTIHTHLNQVSGIILEVAKECNIPNRIAHSHSSNNLNNIFIKVYKIYLQSKINKNATIKLACSENAAKWLYKKENKNAIIVNNAIDIKKFSFNEKMRKNIREQLNIDNKCVVFGHVGNFIKVKNHDFLIDVFDEYRRYNSNTMLLLAGDGELKEKIKNKVKMLGLENNVVFLGSIKNINEYYSAFDVLLFPSLYEGLSLVLIESQCNGLKIVASNSIDHKSDITGNISFVDLSQSYKFWAQFINKMSFKRNYNINGLKKSGYDLKEVVAKMENIYLGGYANNENSILYRKFK